MRSHVTGPLFLGVLLILVLPCDVLLAQATRPPTPRAGQTGNGTLPNNVLVTPPLSPAPSTQPGLGGIVLMEELPYFPAQRFWVNAEYLLWWLNGDPLPPLVTTGPPTSGGILGPGSDVLFGNNRVGTQGRSGGRITAGYWLDPDQLWAVEGSFFMLQSVSDRFAAGSPGSPVLARPFFNTLLGQQDAEAIAFPGAVSGNLNVNATSSSLLGAETLLRRNFYQWTSRAAVVRVSALGGFRFLDFRESLAVQENLTSLSPLSPVPLGTMLAVGDRFGTRNDFYGGELGLAGQLYRRRCMFTVQGKLALGSTSEVVQINGNTVVTVPGAAPVYNSGGLLALSTNSGRHYGQTFSCVPELGLGLNYALTRRLSLNIGYTLLYWSNIVRPGRIVDLSVNPNQLPPPLPGGDGHPLFGFQHSGLLAQGLSLGVRFQY